MKPLEKNIYIISLTVSPSSSLSLFNGFCLLADYHCLIKFKLWLFFGRSFASTSIWWANDWICLAVVSCRLRVLSTLEEGKLHVFARQMGRRMCMRCVLILIIPQAEFIKHKIFSFFSALHLCAFISKRWHSSNMVDVYTKRTGKQSTKASQPMRRSKQTFETSIQCWNEKYVSCNMYLVVLRLAWFERDSIVTS